MATQVNAKGVNWIRRSALGIAICSLVTAVAALGLWVTHDRNWEQTWKHRIRVETPLGAEKAFVLAWIEQNCETVPHVDAICEDTLQDIPIVQLAGIRATDVSSYSRMTVSRKDLVAGERDHMRVYHFYGSDDRVVGQFYLPFHEIARFEHAHQLLASR